MDKGDKEKSIGEYEKNLYITFDGNPINIAFGHFRFEVTPLIKEHPAQNESKMTKESKRKF